MKKTLMMALLGTAVLTGQAQADMFEDVEATEHRVSFASPADYFEFTFTGFKVSSGNNILVGQKPVASYEVKTKVPRQIAIGWDNPLDDASETLVTVMQGTSATDNEKAVFSFFGTSSGPQENTDVLEVDTKEYLVTTGQVTRQAGNIWFTGAFSPTGSGLQNINSGKYRLNMTAAVYNP